MRARLSSMVRPLLTVVCVAAFAAVQGLLLMGRADEPARSDTASMDAWPTHYGDYSGRRFSPLAQIAATNVRNLALAWIYRASAQQVLNSGGEYRPGDPYYWGGPDTSITIKATPLMRDGILYLAVPDHAYAIDARSGKEIWHHFWRTRGGIHIGNRGVGLRDNAVFFETPDCYLVSLDATTGKERWHKEIADVRQEYFCTPAPIVIGNHVIVGVGGDSLDVQGFLEARDADTGDLQWRW